MHSSAKESDHVVEYKIIVTGPNSIGVFAYRSSNI